MSFSYPNPSPQEPDLDRFAQEFEDEARLREILRDLLIRTGAKSVRITHGTNERGKDLVFYKSGGLSRDVLYACVVKNERITGRADSRSGAQTVLNQAIQAISEPYADPVTGKEEKVHTVYIMSPFEGTSEATESIKSQLREQARRVEFICGIDLLALFQEYWADFLRFESAILTRYLTSLTSGLSVDKALVTLLTKHNANFALRPFESFYVSSSLEIRLDTLEAPHMHFPGKKVFDEPLTWKELEDIVMQLRFWRGALRSTELTGESESTLRALTEFSVQFCRDAKKYWESAQTTRQIRESHPQRPEERTISVLLKTQSLYEQMHSIVDRVQSQLIQIEKASRALQRLAAKKHNPEDLLTNESFNLFSSGYDFLNAAPGLIKQKPGCNISLDSERLFIKNGATLITGPPGSGKTSFCRWQTLKAIDLFSSDWKHPLPIYVPAHRVRASADAGFENAFLGETETTRFFPNVQLKQDASIRLFVDGLDEVPDRENQHRIVQAIQDGLARYPRLTVIITSRPYVWGSWLNWLPRVHIAELKDLDQRNLAERWLDNSAQVKEFFLQLNSSPALKKLMGTPLLATLILNLYRKTPTIPENRASLYRAFVDLYSGGWDAAKEIQKTGRFSPEQKLRSLPALAYRMHMSHQTECTEAMFEHAIKDTMPSKHASAGDILSEIVQDGILVRVGKELMFVHLSFQEYLAAQFLPSDPRGSRATQALRTYLRGEDWWKEVVEFYAISREDPSSVDAWIRRISRSMPSQSGGDHESLAGRLDQLANVMAETCPGYLPKFRPSKT